MATIHREVDDDTTADLRCGALRQLGAHHRRLAPAERRLPTHRHTSVLVTCAALGLMACASKEPSPSTGAEHGGSGGAAGASQGGSSSAGSGGAIDGGQGGTSGVDAASNGGNGGSPTEAGLGAGGPTGGIAGDAANGGGTAIDAASDGGGALAGDGGNAMAGGGVGRDGAADPFEGNVSPTHAGDLWRFTMGDLVFEVNAAKGASVTTFARGGHNVLADGSHFRPSPQKTWGWPPPAEIAQSGYTASQRDNIVVMESQANTQWGIKAKKRFWANAANQVVTLEYTLTNTKSTRASWAPWEVSRVNATGLTFFPEGGAIPAKPASYGSALPLQSSSAVAWLDYQASAYTSGNYIVARDGAEGWSAHAEAGLVFIKSFPDILAAQIPPEEGEIQLWTDATHTALEMENEGAYVALDANQSIVWTMRWYLSALPADTPATVGNAKLLAFVRGQLLH